MTGRRLTVNNVDVQVVGVLRPAFRLVLPAANHAEEQVDVWLPREFAPGLLYRGLTMLGRVAPGASVAQAQAELDALAASFVRSHPGAYPGGLRLTVRPLGEAVKRVLVLSEVALSIVPLIAAGLMLRTRWVARRRFRARVSRERAGWRAELTAGLEEKT